MSVNDAIKDMLYGHEHRWRVAEHELAQARAEAAQWEQRAERAWAERDAALSTMLAIRAEAVALREEVKAMRAVESDARRVVDHWRDAIGLIGPITSLRSDLDALDVLRARKVGG